MYKNASVSKLWKVSSSQHAKTLAELKKQSQNANDQTNEVGQEVKTHRIAKTASVERSVDQLAQRWKADGSIEKCDKYKEAIRDKSREKGQLSDNDETGVIRMEDVLNVQAKKLEAWPAGG